MKSKKKYPASTAYSLCASHSLQQPLPYNHIPLYTIQSPMQMKSQCTVNVHITVHMNMVTRHNSQIRCDEKPYYTVVLLYILYFLDVNNLKANHFALASSYMYTIPLCVWFSVPKILIECFNNSTYSSVETKPCLDK